MNSRRSILPVIRTPEFWLFLVALLVQLLVLTDFSKSLYFLPNSDDPKFYNDWAFRIMRGQWTDGQAFYGLPGYAYVLAAIYSVAGFDPFLIGLLQAVMMALVAVLMLRLARLVFQPAQSEVLDPTKRWRAVTVGLAAGLGWAFFRPANAFSVILMPTIWLVLTYWACVWWAAKTRTATIWKPWLVMGVCVGVVAMLVATILFVLPLMLVAIAATVMPGAPFRQRLPRMLVAAVVLIAGVFAGASPAWVHNYFVARDPVFLSGHSGLNFYMGNNAEATGYPKMPPGLRASQEGLLKDSILVPEAEAGRKLKRAEVSHYWSQKADEWIRNHPLDWLRLLGVKFRNAWNAFQYDDIGAIALLRSQGILPPGFRFGVAAVFGLPGLVWAAWSLCRTRWVVAAVLLHMAALMPVFITERYRLAAVPGLLLLGAFWLWQGWYWLSKRQWCAGGGWLAATVVALWFVTIPHKDLRALTLDDHNLGVRALEAGDLETAEKALIRAYQYGPDSAETNFALGNLWLAKDDPQRAKLAYRRTLELNPRHGGAFSNLGVIAMRQKFWRDAEKFFQAAIVIEPEDAKTYYLIALVRYDSGRSAEARAPLEKALSLKPGQRQFLELQQKLAQPSQDLKPEQLPIR
ncbi:tetratricopeptide repeat protein [Verrucomicrobiota bacterium sgz303538]